MQIAEELGDTLRPSSQLRLIASRRECLVGLRQIAKRDTRRVSVKKRKDNIR